MFSFADKTVSVEVVDDDGGVGALEFGRHGACGDAVVVHVFESSSVDGFVECFGGGFSLADLCVEFGSVKGGVGDCGNEGKNGDHDASFYEREGRSVFFAKHEGYLASFLEFVKICPCLEGGILL